MSHSTNLANRPAPDKVLVDIADYVLDYEITNADTLNTARNCLIDTIGCGLLALAFPECTRHLGPIVPGAEVQGGARVFGTGYELDPVKGAFDIGAIIRWLDFNDTWLAAEWGHPSDNLGAIMALADYLSRQNEKAGKSPITMRKVLECMVKAHEIQGVLALENSFNRVGLDHVLLVRVASTALAAHLLGASRAQIIDALSLAFVDGSSLRTYRHAPNAGSRKSWAAGDATSRAVRLAMMVMNGEMGYPSALTAPTWGFYDVSFKGKSFSFPQSYGHYVMDNILFKISFPAEFHAQTAVECALKLHPIIKDRMDDIETIHLTTHESAIRIISKEGELNNPADRDHCLQYMVAVGLLEGDLTASHYSDDYHRTTPAIDALRAKMVVKEDARYSREYLEADKRSIANAMRITFKDGTSTDTVEVEYPIGHKVRRAEGIPVLEAKFKKSVASVFDTAQQQAIFDIAFDQEKLEAMPANAFMDLFVKRA